MSNRFCLQTLLIAGLLLPLTSCGGNGLSSIEIVPSGAVSMTVGEEIQFTAWGLYGNASKLQSNQNITGQVTWGYTTSALEPCPVTPAQPGCFMAVSPGVAVVGASAPGFTGTIWSQANATITVAACTTGCTTTSTEPVTALTITPSTDSLAQVGQTAQFIAIATTNTGLQKDVTSLTATSGANGYINWGSTNAGVATICNAGAPTGCTSTSDGLATATGQGSTPITAMWTNPDGTEISASATLSVTGVATEPLQLLAITPVSQNILQGQFSQLIAIGTFSATAQTSGTQNLTSSSAVTWASSNNSIATVTKGGTNCTPSAANCGGYIQAIGPGTAVITAIAANPDKSLVTTTATVTVTATGSGSSEPFVSLAIVPASQSLNATGQTAQFIAIGTTGTGATVDLNAAYGATAVSWTSSNSQVAIPTAGGSPGQFSAQGNGAAAITATFNNSTANGISTDLTSVTGSAALTVAITAAPEPLLSVSIVPISQSAAVGQPVQLLAIGDFSSSAPASIGPGQQNMAKVSSYVVNWYSSNPSVATICSQGLPAASCTGVPDGVVTGVSAGTTAITAIATGNPDKSAVTASATFTVSGLPPSTISSLSIFPGSQSITMPEVGQPNPTVNLVVIGTNGAGLQTNVTSQISWTSSNPAVVPTTNCSIAGSSPATGCNIISGPNSAVVTAIGPGTTTITASYSNVGSAGSSVVTQTATLTVTGPAAEPLLSLAILPNAPSVQYPAQTSQLTAVGTFSQAPVTQNLTNTVTWSSSNPLIATVCNAVATTSPVVPVSCATTPGLVTAVAQGTVAITATTANTDGSLVYATVPFAVQAGSAVQMASLTIVPSSLSLSATGQPGSLIALGTSTTTGLQQDVTDSTQLAWVSSNPAIATVSSLPAGTQASVPPGNQTQTCALNNATPPVQVCSLDPPGVVKGVSVGSTNITAEWTNPAAGSNPATVVTATATVAVTSTPAAEPLLAITVLPTTVAIQDLYGTGQFLAFGTFSTAPTSLDITNGFFHAGFSSPQYPSSSCTDAYATADAATVAADIAANPPLPVTNLPYAQCAFVPVTWVSLPDPFDFPINSAGAAGATGGLITAEDPGSEDVYAAAANPDGTLVYSSTGPSGGGSATFSCLYVPPTYATETQIIGGYPTIVYIFSEVLNVGSCNGLTVNNALVSTLTVFDANLTSTGLNQSDWLITAPSATTPPVTVIHCGPGSLTGGSVCESTYPNGSVVTVTAPAETGVSFGGWSDNCAPTAPISAAGPNSCTVVVGGNCTYNSITTTYECTASNVSVGAIFN